jgi:nucleoside-diphosphate kinase
MDEATLVIVKPDGLKKSLTGDILSRLSKTGLRIIGAKVIEVSENLACVHYSHLKEKSFYKALIQYITGHLHGENRVLALIYYGKDAIRKVRDIAGATNPEEAEPTSIRGAYGRILTSGLYENVIHASSDSGEAEREIKLWFEPQEIVHDLYPTKFVKAPHEKKAWL